jgi:hypothetical protein
MCDKWLTSIVLSNSPNNHEVSGIIISIEKDVQAEVK